ncbi:MAG: inositol monophosphatase, partial [Planctomycetaceae bacterium]|nr:inositol monophosphatase [Planctomycetaceae bacterium]
MAATQTDRFPDPETLVAWQQAAITAAHRGGDVLQQWVGRFSVREKSKANLVTEADEASQAAIVQSLSEEFPDHGFLGEEDLKQHSDTSAPLWIIDPLDGTSNYVHGFPYYAVSIAIAIEGTVLAGVIYDPNRRETFSAAAGLGATLNGQSIQTSGETDPRQTMALASLPVCADPGNPAVTRFLKALPQLQTVQRTGSAALNLASVACGRADAFWSTSLNAWDVAAGVLLVQEAGGSVTNVAGEPVDIFLPSLLAAASETLRKDLVKVI